MTRRRHQDVIQLTRWQATGALLGVLVLTVLVFFIGVVVGTRGATRLPPEVARIAAPAGYAAPDQRLGRRERGQALAELHPGTATIDHDLSRPIERVVPRDPTDAARIETHIQLARSRAFGVAGVDGAPAGDAVVLEPAAVVVPGAAVERGEVEGRDRTTRYALQVSAFDARTAADAVADQLAATGHPAHVREVTGSGRRFFRVEVGDFAAQQDALSYQRRFERDSGYSTVLVTTP